MVADGPASIRRIRDGVASIGVTGGLEQRVLVTLDPAKLAATGISVGQVSGVLAVDNLALPTGLD